MKISSGLYLIFLAVVTTSPLSVAQWGTGLNMASVCPQGGLQMAPGAFNSNDQLSNLTNQIQNIDSQIEAMQERRRSLTGRLSASRRKAGRVLGNSVVSFVERHFRKNLRTDDYQSCLTPPRRTAPPSSALPTPTGRFPASDASEPPEASDPDLDPVPAALCHNGRDLWLGRPNGRGFIEDEGEGIAEVGALSKERICAQHLGLNEASRNFRPASASNRELCIEGLEDLSDDVRQIRVWDERIARLRTTRRQAQKNFEKMQDRITEGNLCSTGNCGHQGLASNTGLNNNVLMLSNLMNGGFGNNNFMGNNLGLTNAGGFTSAPYAARVPGYLNLGPGGQYGTAPGAIGTNGFGCAGTQQGLFANPNVANGFQNYGRPNNSMYRLANPSLVGNQYGNRFANPNQINGLYNPGFGPGISPIQNGGFQGFNGPGAVPFLGANQFGQGGRHPFFNSGYQYNPGFGGQPNFGNRVGGNGAPIVVPPNGGGSLGYGYGGGFNGGLGQNFGGNFGGGLGGNLAYGTNVPYGTGMPYFNNGAAYGSPVGNYNMQLNQLQQQIGIIRNGAGFGGQAPIVAPYPGPNFGR